MSFPAHVLTIYLSIRIYASMKLEMLRMRSAADEASELLKALANRHRLLILCQLVDRERSVGELAEHLALLRRDGLVAARREGQTIWYSISSAPTRALLQTLYRIYCAPAPRCRPSRRSKHQRMPHREH